MVDKTPPLLDNSHLQNKRGLFEMKNLKIVRYKPDSNEKVILSMQGYLRISTNGVLQVYSEQDNNQRANGICLLALPDGEWLSAEVVK